MILSVPSYVIPGTYAENLRFLADKREIAGVELLFYFWDAETRDLLARESEEIHSFDGRFRFTAHLPDQVGREHREILEATASFVRSYIVHPPREPDALPAFVRLMDDWRSRFGDRFFLENVCLDSFERARKAIPDMPLCVDEGHLLMEGRDPAAFIAGLLEEGRRVEELHLHGIVDGSDHKPFDAEASWLPGIAPFLRSFQGVTEIELFAWEEAEAALNALRAIVEPAPDLRIGKETA